MESTSGAPETAKLGRLVAFYVVLGLLTAVVSFLVISKGQDEKPQPEIAGGYDASAPNPCLGKPAAPAEAIELPSTAPAQAPPSGPSFDLKQSGQFINLANPQGTLSGKLRLREGSGEQPRLTGDINCVDGKTLPFEGTVTPGNRGSITGTLGATPVTAALRRDPPDPGAAKPRPPASIASLYRLSPRSTCLGGLIELEAHGKAYELHAREQALGEVSYDKTTGAITGDVRCTRGGHVLLRAVAVDRNLNNVQLLPLDEATPAQPAAGGAPAPPAGGEAPKPVLTTPSGLGPAGERVTATRQREAFGVLIAAFFIAVAIVMIVARLFGLLAVKIGQPRVMGEVVAGIALGPTILGAISPALQATLFPSDILPAFGIAANLGLIFYMFLVGLELDSEPAQGQAHAGGGDLQRQRRAADDARHRRRAAALHAARPGQEVRRVRAVHGRVDVDHRVPGARAHPRRAAHAQAPGRGAGARVRGDRRRHGVVLDRAGDRGGRRRLGLGGRRDGRAGNRLLPRHGPARAPADRACVGRLRRGRSRAGRLGGDHLRRRADLGVRDGGRSASR